ncbi:MAG: cell division protein FtsZ [Clostridia bacterium]|nr:cell division protein FtsZ [Clostridia bacterium]
MFNDLQGIGSQITGRAKIKVIGIGGAGNNAVNRMLSAGINSADYYVVNTDSQVLMLSPCENKIQIGSALTKGLGAGADPEVGRAAAEESKDLLTEAVKGTDLLFITAGMGGGTGTGAAPVLAKIARDLKILTIAVVTEPFSFEGRQRLENTAKGLDNLKKYVDTLIVIPNDKIKTVVPKHTPIKEALRVADDILKQSIKGLTELIVNPALINLDFADVKTILKDRGVAHLGVGVAKGDNRVVEAVRLAVNCPLLETTIEGARGVILNVVGGEDLTIDEVTDAAELIKSVVDASANIIFGARIDPNVQDEVEITIIATSFPGYDSKLHDEPKSGYSNISSYAPDSYSRRLSVTEPVYKTQQYPSSSERSYSSSVNQQLNQPVRREPEPEIIIERPAEKNIPKFAQILKNLGKRRDD